MADETPTPRISFPIHIADVEGLQAELDTIHEQLATKADRTELDPIVASIETKAPADHTHALGDLGDVAFVPPIAEKDVLGYVGQAWTNIEVSDPVTPPEPTRTVLGPDDLEWIGLYRTPLDSVQGPNQGWRAGYSKGIPLAGRYVDGNLRMFMGLSGGSQWQQPIGELLIDGEPGKDLPTAHRCTHYSAWGMIYGKDGDGINRRDIPDGPTAASGQNPNGSSVFGLQWDGEKLIWVVGANYRSIHHRTIGATTFEGNAGQGGTYQSYGTWRTKSYAKKTNGYMLDIPESERARFNGDNLMIAGVQTSINSANVWGYSLRSFNSLPLLSTPHDDHYDTNERSIPDTVWMDSDRDHPMARKATWRFCTVGKGGSSSPPYNCADGSTVSDPRPFVSDIDTGGGAAWVKTATKEGIIFVGNFVDQDPSEAYRIKHYNGEELPHEWYGLANAPCCHKHTGLLSGTGPHTPSYFPSFWFYDQKVLTNAQTPFERANSPVHSHVPLRQYTTYIRSLNNYYNFGAWFDRRTELLYVRQEGVDNSQYEWLPVIHVFRIKP